MIVVDEFSQEGGIVAIDGKHDVEASPAVFVIENSIDEVGHIDDVAVGTHYLHSGLVNGLIEQIRVLGKVRLSLGHFIHPLDFLPDGILGCLDVDIGIAETRMTLVAAADGVGSCILANIERDSIREALGLPASKEIATIVAFGYPTHESHIVPMKDGDVKYYLDENKDYCVPKRSREELFRMI